MVSFVWPFLLMSMIRKSGAKSAKTCLQAPQGGQKSSVSAAIAITSKARFPSDIALKIATRSAQTVKPYELISILHPEYCWPSGV